MLPRKPGQVRQLYLFRTYKEEWQAAGTKTVLGYCLFLLLNYIGH